MVFPLENYFFVKTAATVSEHIETKKINSDQIESQNY